MSNHIPNISTEPFQYHDTEQFGYFSVLHTFLPEPEYPSECKSLYDKLVFCRTLPKSEMEQYLHYRKYQHTHQLSQMPKVLSLINPHKDTWISQAEFKACNRQVVNLLRVSLAWVDIDYYNSIHADTAPEKVVDQLLWYCRYNGYPEPSIIVYSGRGLQIKWLFNSPAPDKALVRWNALQKNVCDKFSQFGADPKALDASRVLRLVGTINSKSGEYCRILHQTIGDCGSVKRYSFDFLCDQFLPFSREECRDMAEKQKNKPIFKSKAGTIKAHQANSFNAKTLNWHRLLDLRTLAQLRGWHVHGAENGYQDLCIFLSVCFLSWNVAPEQLVQEIECLASEFCPSWQLHEATAVTATAIARARMASTGKKIEFNGKFRDPRYTFSNRYLIDTLQITDTEQKQLLTIISHNEGKRRERESLAKKRRELGMVDRRTYLEAVEKKRYEVRARRAKGESFRQIAAATGISVGSISAYIK